MVKLLNIDLPHSTLVWELNKSASAYACTQLQLTGADMSSTNWCVSLAVSEWVENQEHATILSTGSESWVDANWQTMLQAFNVTTGPHMKEAM